MNNRVWEILKKTYEGIREDSLGIVASGVAFYCFLGIFPFITLCISLYQTFFSGIVLETSSLQDLIPPVVYTTISNQMNSVGAKPVFLSLGSIISILISLWTASMAMKSFIEGLNISYDIERKKAVRGTLLSLATTLIFASMLFSFFLVASFLPVILKFMFIDQLGESFLLAFNWLFMGGALFFLFLLVYKYLPNHEKKAALLDGATGALVSSVFIVLLSYAFTAYISKVANYNAIYGTLSSVIIFLIWLRLMILVILSGAKLNCSRCQY